MNADRAGRIYKVRRTGVGHPFTRDPRMFLDRDNPDAVYTMDDIPADLLWYGPLERLLAPMARRKLALILESIASFDRSLRPSDLEAMFREAVECGFVENRVEDMVPKEKQNRSYVDMSIEVGGKDESIA